MTFKTDAQNAIASIINDTDGFGEECIHTPRNGVAQPAFNCLIGNSPMHGNEVTTEVFDEDITITVLTDEVTAVKKRDFILVTGTSFEVVNVPVADSEFSGTSIIVLRTERTRQTKL